MNPYMYSAYNSINKQSNQSGGTYSAVCPSDISTNHSYNPNPNSNVNGWGQYYDERNQYSTSQGSDSNTERMNYSHQNNFYPEESTTPYYHSGTPNSNIPEPTGSAHYAQTPALYKLTSKEKKTRCFIGPINPGTHVPQKSTSVLTQYYGAAQSADVQAEADHEENQHYTSSNHGDADDSNTYDQRYHHGPEILYNDTKQDQQHMSGPQYPYSEVNDQHENYYEDTPNQMPYYPHQNSAREEVRGEYNNVVRHFQNQPFTHMAPHSVGSTPRPVRPMTSFAPVNKPPIENQTFVHAPNDQPTQSQSHPQSHPTKSLPPPRVYTPLEIRHVKQVELEELVDKVDDLEKIRIASAIVKEINRIIPIGADVKINIKDKETIYHALDQLKEYFGQHIRMKIRKEVMAYGFQALSDKFVPDAPNTLVDIESDDGGFAKQHNMPLQMVDDLSDQEADSFNPCRTLVDGKYYSVWIDRNYCHNICMRRLSETYRSAPDVLEFSGFKKNHSYLAADLETSLIIQPSHRKMFYQLINRGIPNKPPKRNRVISRDWIIMKVKLDKPKSGLPGLPKDLCELEFFVWNSVPRSRQSKSVIAFLIDGHSIQPSRRNVPH